MSNEKIEDKKIFESFGYWMKYQEGVFDFEWFADNVYSTLEKSTGEIDWNYGMIKSIETLAKKTPEKTIKILRSYLIKQAKLDTFRATVYIDDFMAAMKFLYENKETRDEVCNLIGELIKIGSSRFWKLKEIISD